MLAIAAHINTRKSRSVFFIATATFKSHGRSVITIWQAKDMRK